MTRRLTRIPRRGALTLLCLAVVTLAVLAVVGSAIAAALATSWLLVIPMAAVLATFGVLVMRAWSVGTFVGREGVIVQRLFTTTPAPWPLIARVIDADGRVLLELRDGRVVTTTITRWSTGLRQEGYDMAKLMLEDWSAGRQSR